ncbi:hypothetical protein [Streptomyces canus]|uniref:hypothetical protein n=1 Tax=Streptomyces canus TaxID=58343 RepID=UPI002E261B22
MTDPRETELRRILAVVVDTDRGENPLGWSDLPAPAGEEEQVGAGPVRPGRHG